MRNILLRSFIERSEGWSLRSGRVLDVATKMPFFSPKFKSAATFQLQPKREASSSSLGDRLEKDP